MNLFRVGPDHVSTVVKEVIRTWILLGDIRLLQREAADIVFGGHSGFLLATRIW